MAEHLKIVGPPGTGKTSFLLNVVDSYLIKGFSPHEICYTSFTKAACREVADRAQKRFGFGRETFTNFGTEHSICFRLLGLKHGQVFTRHSLKQFGKKYRYDFSSDNDNESLENRYQESMLSTVADHYEFFVSYAENRMMLTPNNFDSAYRDFVRSVAIPDGFTKAGLESYIGRRQRYKQENNLWSFGDMIVGVLEKDLFPEGIRVLCADEMQDSSPLLYALVKRWSSKVESYYVGADPLQAIFSFAGASPDLFFEFPGEEQVLGTSYRLTEEVKDYAKRIINQTDLPFPEFSSSGRHGGLGRKSFYSVDWGGLQDAFLLMRTRWLISQAVDYFVSLGIPFRCERGRQSPLNTTKGRAYLTLIKMGEGRLVSDFELKNLMKHTSTPYLERGAKTKVKKLAEGIYNERELKELGFTQGFFEALKSDPLDILCRDVELWEKSYLHRVYRKYGADVFSTDTGLTVTTIHGSKGREKSDVYLCPDMTSRVWDTFIRDKQSETLVYYVGATRAIKNLTILLPSKDYSFPLPRIGVQGG